MHLPFLQIANEVFEHHAPELAITLDWREADAGWGLAKLFKWALGRCPDDAPPSANDVVHGTSAARLVASAAGFHGDPSAFIEACSHLPDAPLESVAGGIRIRGLDRYDRAWGKNHKAEWPAWKDWLDARGRGERTPRPDRKDIRSILEDITRRERAESGTKAAPEPAESAPKAAPKRAENGPPDADADAERRTTLSPDSAESADPPPLLEAQTAPTPSPARTVFEHWRKVMGKNGATQFDDKRRRLIASRLREGWTVEQLQQAVDGCRSDPWWMGSNDRNTPFNGLKNILADADHIEKFIAKAKTAQARAPPPSTEFDVDEWGQPKTKGVG